MMTANGIRFTTKIIVSAVTVFYGLAPALADFNETHLFNPLWSEHARFHVFWFLAFAVGVAGTALYLIWWRNETTIPIVLGLMFAAGFWVTTSFQSAYGGALVEINGHEEKILGIEANLFLFFLVSVILISTLYIDRRCGIENNEDV